MKYEIKSILVPTDFSECANNALRIAIGMAKRHNAIIHLLHIVEPIYLGRTYDILGSIIKVEQTIRNDAYDNLGAHKQKIWDLSKVQVEIFSTIGSVSNNVNEYVEKHKIDIIVMGTHGLSGFKEFFAGTNTYEVIKTANCPVLSIPEAFDETGFNSILYPIRAVGGVVEKYDYIKPIMEKNDAVLHILGIIHKNDMQERYKVNKDFDAVTKLIVHDEKLVSYESIQTENIADKILEIAHKRNDDLIIINATLDKKWYYFFKGNFTQKIINHSKIPVLSVKPALTPEIIKRANEHLIAEANYYTSLTIKPIAQ